MDGQQTKGPLTPMELPGKNSDAYGDGDVPEIDLPGAANATPSIPEECPSRSLGAR
ncbi:hypothetical protein [Lacrimispora sp. 210928-DFI.3.58]|uniref:hypothetical protein n=1 Tax=Lacrimispora sp. 210928-DFI.3.58 TaxID=2883214 RepID=UPI0015B39718|nr:hypothetical protein [Lacrimispora sp. 210928-DFI.3.58]MCB7317372.1 hypothetical protein [Lacrimispora sp. 210928-DFI.3.58]